MDHADLAWAVPALTTHQQGFIHGVVRGAKGWQILCSWTAPGLKWLVRDYKALGYRVQRSIHRSPTAPDLQCIHQVQLRRRRVKRPGVCHPSKIAVRVRTGRQLGEKTPHYFGAHGSSFARNPNANLWNSPGC
jgi:hypothetical protein